MTGSATSALSGAACNRYTYRYGYDLYALAHSTGANVASQSDGKTWYMLVANYAFGRELAADFTDAIEAKGGTVLPSDPVAVAATDYSAALEAAKNSKAQVLGFMNYGPDTLNSVKQARQLGLDKQMQFVVGLLFLFLGDCCGGAGRSTPARARPRRGTGRWTTERVLAAAAKLPATCMVVGPSLHRQTPPATGGRFR